MHFKWIFVCDFVIYIGHLKNNGILSYTDFSYVDTFAYPVFKKLFINMTISPSKKSLRNWKWLKFWC